MIAFIMQLAPDIVCQLVIQCCNPQDCVISANSIHKENSFICWGAAVQTRIWTISLNIWTHRTWVLPFCVITLVANYQCHPVTMKTHWYSHLSFYSLQITSNTNCLNMWYRQKPCCCLPPVGHTLPVLLVRELKDPNRQSEVLESFWVTVGSSISKLAFWL